MYTQCPQCATVFRINVGQLTQARGRVRCGVCQHDFNALELLSERLDAFSKTGGDVAAAARHPGDISDHAAPDTAESGAATHAQRQEDTLAESAAASDSRAEQQTTAENHGEVEAAVPQQAPENPLAPASAAPFLASLTEGEPAHDEHTGASASTGFTSVDPAPAHTLREIKPFSATEHERLGAAPWVNTGLAAANAPRREPTVSSVTESLPGDETAGISPIQPEARHDIETQAAGGGGWFKTLSWALANLALIAVLLGQYAYFNREEMAQYPELRPWLSGLCGLIACDVPLRKDASRIALTNRVVQSHPSHEHALLIDATLVNEAAFTQPYPVVELRFSDLNNNSVAGRRFRPYEYLPQGINIKQGMAPKEPLRFSLEIADPGKEAVSFQFNLL